MSEPSDIDEIEDEDAPPGWIVTYGDLMTLLLVFFVMLFIMSDIKTTRFAMISESISDALVLASDNTLEGSDAPIPSDAAPLSPPEDVVEIPDHTAFLKDINEVIEEREIKDLTVEEDNQYIVIRMDGHALFRSGEASMIAASKPVLRDLKLVFDRHPEYTINIKGHTDNVPISSVRFPSNWELSAVRATTILRYFIGLNVDPKRLTATGLGDLIPVGDNNTAEGRAMNRRVEFVLEKKE